MASYTRREFIVRRVEFVVPAPGAYVELCRAVSEAERRYRTDKGLPAGATLYDDALTVSSGDDEVVIWYTVEVPDAQP